MILAKRPHWWDGTLWFRVYSPGGYDGWRTITGRRMPCDTMLTALNAPHLHDDIRRLTARRQKPATHDLTRADYSFTPVDDGQRGRIACWTGAKPKPGDCLILRNGTGTTRYRVISMDPCFGVDPPTMWMADLVFAPRPDA